MNIQEMLETYIERGYDYPDASSKVCQDILLLKISNSGFSKHITIKGGVVMHSISNNIRRATRDLDLDFIKYSLGDDSIRNFIDKNANLLINSKEQILTEKLKSLLKLGFRSTRYKDLFDFYYLINMAGIDKRKLEKCFDTFIFKDINMKENNISDVIHRLNEILNSERYFSMLNNPKVNWIGLPVNEVINNVLNYFKSLEIVEV